MGGHLADDEANNPSPAEIAERCAEIRAGWRFDDGRHESGRRVFTIGVDVERMTSLAPPTKDVDGD